MRLSLTLVPAVGILPSTSMNQELGWTVVSSFSATLEEFRESLIFQFQMFNLLLLLHLDD